MSNQRDPSDRATDSSAETNSADAPFPLPPTARSTAEQTNSRDAMGSPSAGPREQDACSFRAAKAADGGKEAHMRDEQGVNDTKQEPQVIPQITPTMEEEFLQQRRRLTDKTCPDEPLMTPSLEEEFLQQHRQLTAKTDPEAPGTPSAQLLLPGAYAVQTMEGRDQVALPPIRHIIHQEDPSASSEKSASSTLLQATPVDASTITLAVADPVVTGDQRDGRAGRNRVQTRDKAIFLGALLVLGCGVALGVVLGLIYGLPKDTDNDRLAVTVTMTDTSFPSSAPSMAPSSTMDAILELLPTTTVTAIFANVSSPQHEAYDWLSRQDNLDDLEEWQQVQLFAITTFFYAFEGPHWPQAIQDDWLVESKSECYWFSSKYGRFEFGESYVEKDADDWAIEPCNSRGEFQYLILKGLQLEGHQPVLPPEMALLTAMQIISLPENQIESSMSKLALTDMLQEMTSLRVLSLRDNAITGTIPSELGLRTSLSFITVANNQLTGTIPKELGMLTKIERLYLSRNPQLRGSIPTELALLTDMYEIFAGKTSLTGELPSQLGLLTAMEAIGIATTSNRGRIPSELGNMANLTRLYLSQASYSGGIPSELGLLSELSVLQLGESLLTGPIPSQLGLSLKMVELDLQHNFLSGPIPVQLGRLTNLKRLNLFNNSLSATIPSELAQLTNLEILNLSELPLLTGEIPGELGRLVNQNLSVVSVTGSRGVFGSIPTSLCFLNNASCVFKPWRNCSMEFDCSKQLCGCDCSC